MPLLATKLYIPKSRPNMVRRPRLINLLDQGLHRGFTLISAPAGFGKTSVVTEWIEEQNNPIAWLSLDQGDNDLKGFLAYVITSIQQIIPGFGSTLLGQLNSPQCPPAGLLTTAILNEIASVSVQFTLVLDDYHVLESPEIDQLISSLLEHLLPQFQLIVTTREDPQFPLARLRAKNRLTELRAAQLRFSSAEASQFFEQMTGMTLSEENITSLENRTEGWVAGLQLAALSMQGSSDVGQLIHSFSGNHQFVTDYLVEEVLHRQPEPVQEFLLNTSVLNRLCGELCDCLVESSVSGQQRLEQIEGANLFLIPLDSERRWYRYHHLFAQLLQEKLSQTDLGKETGAGNMVSLHEKASRWFERNGDMGEAIHHGVQAKDLDRVAELAELAWPDMDHSYQMPTWLAWVAPVPEETVALRPALGVAIASALLDSGRIEEAQERLETVDASLTESAKEGGNRVAKLKKMVVVDPEQFDSIEGNIALLRAYLAMWQRDSQSTQEQVELALTLLPKENNLKRGVASALMGLFHWSHDRLGESEKSFCECVRTFKLAGDFEAEVSGSVGRNLVLIAQGRFEEAKAVYSAFPAEQSKEFEFAQIINFASRSLGLAEICLEQNQLDEALQYLEQAKAHHEQVYIYRWPHLLSLLNVRIHEAQGDYSGALAGIQEAEDNFMPTPVPILRPLDAWKARLWLKLGRVKEADSWAKFQGFSVDDPAEYLKEFPTLVFCRLQLAHWPQSPAQNFLAGLDGLLHRYLDAAEKGQRYGSQIEICLVLAQVLDAQNDQDQALTCLGKALELAQKETHIQPFLFEAEGLAKLISKAAAQGIESPILTRIQGELGNHPPAKSPVSSASMANAALLEPLSKREREILGLIGQGLSNQEISERLFLALSTVKGHNQNIFGKLQVQRRTEAIARARELNLL